MVRLGVDQRFENMEVSVFGEALEQHLKAAPTPADPPTLEIHALVQVELHDLRERGEHSNVTWGERVCGCGGSASTSYGHARGAQLR